MIELDPHLNYAPEKTEHIHIMGICGTGMAALAGMLKDSGYTITGSDSQVYPPMSGFLAQLQIPVSSGYGKENLNPTPDLVIVGNVITRKNPEAIALSGLDIPYLSFPQALSHFFIKSRLSLVIAGTHGKTTTCSLLASSLYHAEKDPTFMIGGIVKEFGTNFRLGEGPYFVAEGDEYDTAFFDKESKFLHYQPQVAVITSIEFDHADIFKDLEAIKKAFRKFVALIPEDGLLIANFDDPNVVEIAKEARCAVQSYGLSDTYNWALGKTTTVDGRTEFAVLKDGSFWGELTVAMTGIHNCLNTLAVCALMNFIGTTRETMNKGFTAFKGVKRRQEVRGIVGGITVIDDFAHHPTAVRETLAALKAGYPGRRLIAVFEPRTNSSRRAIFQKDYVQAFRSADLVLLREPLPIPGFEDDLFSSATLAHDISYQFQLDASSFANTDEILMRLKQILQKGDVVAVLSNGGFDNIHERLLRQLQQS
ncbi:UDP-N-acetylmuramate:L-alanyl-gamma-D-glutamyl-meso-diaminopimelate ligase [Desulforhopalus sp. IMCC35007]|uniref:UDP-N-acetylmuramate:L-alanyl-gamma-D-glutamyl- meso-diaminopimelate ligase n=1 Tax=Desulforhopalus sp. IMCC35007 TaxID=2569543 RepID=UPI00145F6461|nr:UDP-N-acetylmuramate:L-alanyl-gamma-D-glutamyl-meso-diaminopimelate ligase [Desulforhopalus sp. IMCC35007]